MANTRSAYLAQYAALCQGCHAPALPPLPGSAALLSTSAPAPCQQSAPQSMVLQKTNCPNKSCWKQKWVCLRPSCPQCSSADLETTCKPAAISLDVCTRWLSSYAFPCRSHRLSHGKIMLLCDLWQNCVAVQPQQYTLQRKRAEEATPAPTPHRVARTGAAWAGALPCPCCACCCPPQLLTWDQGGPGGTVGGLACHKPLALPPAWQNAHLVASKVRVMH